MLPAVALIEDRLTESLPVLQQNNGNAIGAISILVIVIVPDLEHLNLSQLRCMLVLDNKSIISVAGNGSVITFDRDFLQGVLDFPCPDHGTSEDP